MAMRRTKSTITKRFPSRPIQDNSRTIKRNNDIAHIKERALQTDGNTFRAPLIVDKAWAKRCFRHTYGHVTRAIDITNGITILGMTTDDTIWNNLKS